ncbi:MAG: site-2 protease family protein [Halanaerobiaceae bacterium]
MKLHVSFLIILPFLAWSFGSNMSFMMENIPEEAGELVLNPYLLGFILALALFVSVFLHELSHALVARRQDIETKSINLMLLGGIAEMDDIDEETPDEAAIALAGPGFSLVFGLILFLLHSYLPATWPADLLLLFYTLGYMNIFLGGFNLLPAFPTDGGRVLRALLARKMSYLRATRIAVSIGKAFAVFFGLIGFLSGNFMLIFIAFYIFISASQESYYNLVKDALADYRVKDLMTVEVSVVQKEVSVSRLVDKMFAEKHSGYPVISDGVLAGIVTMEDVQRIPAEEYGQTTVGEIMEEEIKTVRSDDDIYKAFKLLFQENIGRLIVVEEDKMKGIITRSDIMKGFRLQQMRHLNN